MKILILSLFLIPTLCFAQVDTGFVSFPKNDLGEVAFEKILAFDSLSKDQIFDKVRNFCATYFASPLARQAEDKQTGYIAYRGYMEDAKSTGVFKFYIKDGKLKAVLTALTFDIYTPDKSFEDVERGERELYNKRKSKGKPYDNALIKSLSDYMNAMLTTIETKLRAKSDFDF